MSLNLRSSGTPLTQPQLDSNFTFLFGRDITGTTVSGNTVFLNKQNGTSFSFNIPSFTGNTSASCINDLYVSNIHGCSPITIHDSIQSVGSFANGFRSFAFGDDDNTASGDFSFAIGETTIASGNSSHAEGVSTTAIGYGSHTEGNSTEAIGNYSHAEGEGTTSNGISSHAEGFTTTATGDYSHAEGSTTLTTGAYSHAEGRGTKTEGDYSHAEGENTIATGERSHAEGRDTRSLGWWSHAEGSGSYTGVYGYTVTNTTNGVITLDSTYGNVVSQFTGMTYVMTNASGMYGTISGTPTFDGTNTIVYINETDGGETIIAPMENPQAESADQILGGYYSHAEGQGTIARGDNSHAEGGLLSFSSPGGGTIFTRTVANGSYSHAEGIATKALGNSSHSQGILTEAIGTYSFASGSNSKAYGFTSFIHSTDSILTSGATNSVLLGGQNITGSSSNTVYVPNLNINYQPNTHTGTTSQVLVRDSVTGNVEVKNIGNVYYCALFINSSSQPPAGIIPSVTIANGGIADRGKRITGFTQIISNGVVSNSTGVGNYVTSPPSCSFGTFNNNSGVFSITQAGLYLIEGSIHLKSDNDSSVYWQSVSAGTFGLGIHPANDTDIYAGNYMAVLPNVQSEIDVTVSTLIYADGTNDFVSLKHLNWTNRSYNGTVYTSSDVIRFSITKVY